MNYFLLHLRTPAGIERAFAPLPFADLAAAYLDACAAIPDTAAEMLRKAHDPMLCAYLICDMDDHVLEEIPFTDVLRPTLVTAPRRFGRAAPTAVAEAAKGSVVAEARATRLRARQLRAQAKHLVAQWHMLFAAAGLDRRRFARGKPSSA